MENGKAIRKLEKPFPKDFKYGDIDSSARSRLPSSISDIEEPILKIVNLEVSPTSHVVGFKNLNLEVYPSQIVALTDQGIDTALDGRETLLNLFLGQLEPECGEIRINGQAIEPQIPGEIKNAGVALIPEDRDQAGCIPEMSLVENLFLFDPVIRDNATSLVSSSNIHFTNTGFINKSSMKLANFFAKIFLNKKAMRQRALELIEEYNITPPDPDILLSQLSGGNQQRVLLARELSSNPKLLVVGSLTEGLDVTAAADMRWSIQRAAGRGVAVLLITDDIDLLSLAHSRFMMPDISEMNAGTEIRHKNGTV